MICCEPSPNIRGDDNHHEDKDEHKPFPCASPLKKGVGALRIAICPGCMVNVGLEKVARYGAPAGL